MAESRTLTERAAARRAAGAVSGAGTYVCTSCGGAKDESRLNSDRCKDCNGGAGRRRVSVSLPADVYDRLADEAGDGSVGELVQALLIRRDKVRQERSK